MSERSIEQQAEAAMQETQTNLARFAGMCVEEGPLSRHLFSVIAEGIERAATLRGLAQAEEMYRLAAGHSNGLMMMREEIDRLKREAEEGR